MNTDSSPQFAHVVAVSQNGVIGKHGGLPWHLSADLKHFKKITSGSVILMGRKTYESIGRPLPNRLSLVMTSSPAQFSHLEKQHENLRFVSSLEDATKIASEQKSFASNPIYIIGGGELYRQTLNQVTLIHLTQIHADCEGDTFYPNIQNNPAWTLTSRETHHEGDLSFDFCLFRRI